MRNQFGEIVNPNTEPALAPATGSASPECCAEYERSIKEIIGLCALGYAHGLGYNGEPFKFCPWCGRARPNSDSATG